jgi:hypothetical protein
MRKKSAWAPIGMRSASVKSKVRRQSVIDILSISQASIVAVASIHLRTPLAILRKSNLSTHAPALIGAAARRARALAPWLGASLDLDLAMMSERAAAIAFDERDVMHYRSIRHSIRRGDAPIPFGGSCAMHVAARAHTRRRRLHDGERAGATFCDPSSSGNSKCPSDPTRRRLIPPGPRSFEELALTPSRSSSQN